jgi:hypothetical protein
MCTLLAGNIDMKRITIGNGKRHSRSVKKISENSISRRLGNLDKCFLNVVNMKTRLVGEDVCNIPSHPRLVHVGQYQLM